MNQGSEDPSHQGGTDKKHVCRTMRHLVFVNTGWHKYMHAPEQFRPFSCFFNLPDQLQNQKVGLTFFHANPIADESNKKR